MSGELPMPGMRLHVVNHQGKVVASTTLPPPSPVDPLSQDAALMCAWIWRAKPHERQAIASLIHQLEKIEP